VLKSHSKRNGGVNSPLLILFIVLSGLFHFILAGMIMLPHSENQYAGQLLAVTFYKTKSPQTTKQSETENTVDKRTINKKSIKPEKVLAEHKAEKRTEKKIEKETPEKSEYNKKRAATEKDITPTNNKNAKKDVAGSYLPKLTFNKERKSEISGRSSINLKNNSWSEEEKKKYLQHIRKQITSRIKYPSIARRRGIEGEVLVSFNIRKDGSFEKVKIKRKSPYTVLNDAVLKAVENVVVTEKPEEEIAVNIPVNFTLK